MSVYDVYFGDSEIPSSARFGVIDGYLWLSVVMSRRNLNH